MRVDDDLDVLECGQAEEVDEPFSVDDALQVLVDDVAEDTLVVPDDDEVPVAVLDQDLGAVGPELLTEQGVF